MAASDADSDADPADAPDPFFLTADAEVGLLGLNAGDPAEAELAPEDLGLVEPEEDVLGLDELVVVLGLVEEVGFLPEAVLSLDPERTDDGVDFDFAPLEPLAGLLP